MPPPDKLSIVYATDESLAIRARGDFATLCPDWQKLAYATDGVIDEESPWVLTSDSVNFETNGVSANHVIQLRKIGTIRGSGDMLAVESVSGGTITMRRLGQAAGVGQPPLDATGIEFVVASMDPQIEEASFALNRRFGIEARIPLESPDYLYDPRDLREATILTVLRDGYVAEARGKDGDFWGKVNMYDQLLKDVMARLQVRWSELNSQQPVTKSVSSGAIVSR